VHLEVMGMLVEVVDGYPSIYTAAILIQKSFSMEVVVLVVQKMLELLGLCMMLFQRA
jgi:hypothetical protein